MNVINFNDRLVELLPVSVFTSEHIRLVTNSATLGELSLGSKEVCGVVLGDPDKGCLFIQMPNSSKTPDRHFQIAPEVVYILEGVGVRFGGVWHSHPAVPVRRAQQNDEERRAGAKASSFDLDYHPVDKRLFIIHAGILREFDLAGGVIKEWGTESAAV